MRYETQTVRVGEWLGDVPADWDYERAEMTDQQRRTEMRNKAASPLKRFCVSALIVLLAGCYKVERSEELTEQAEITEVVYTPSQHGIGTGAGMSMKGNMVVTTSSVSIPEVHAVVFKCPHGKFIVKRKDVWEKAKVSMKVVVHYKEVFHVTDTNRELVKYDFLYFTEAK